MKRLRVEVPAPGRESFTRDDRPRWTEPPMNMTRATAPESLGVVWDASVDEVFFRIVRHLFPSDFVFGAGVVLSHNGPESNGE